MMGPGICNCCTLGSPRYESEMTRQGGALGRKTKGVWLIRAVLPVQAKTSGVVARSPPRLPLEILRYRRKLSKAMPL